MGHFDFNGYYSILNLTYPATQADIKKAWLACAKKFHPDVNKSPDATAFFQKLQKAYDVLKDERRKEEYDKACREDFSRKEDRRRQAEAEQREKQQREAEKKRRAEEQQRDEYLRREAAKRNAEKEQQREAERERELRRDGNKLQVSNIFNNIKSIKIDEAIWLLAIPCVFFIAFYCFFISWDEKETQSLEIKTKELEAKAKTGDKKAQIELAMMYFPKDPDKGISLLQEEADSNNADAQNTLGYFYATGTYILLDYEKAVEFFHKAADQGNALAKFNLGYMNLNGYGVPQNTLSASSYFYAAAKTAAGAGNYDLVTKIALGYYNNKIPDTDRLSLAFNFFQEAVDHGDAEAEDGLGVMYITHYNDYGKAVKYFYRSMAKGNYDAKKNLSIMYYCGYGVPKDIDKSRFFYNGYYECEKNDFYNSPNYYLYKLSVPNIDLRFIE